MEEKTTILYVEDHPDTLDLVALLLRRKGFNVIGATDAKSAIEAGSSMPFDILVADIGLPDGTGWQVAEALRKIKSFPAIALTAFCTEAEMQAHKAAGFDLCLSKPHSTADLISAISILLESKAV